MTTTLKHTNSCPACGRALPAGALAGMCPACLLAQGAETDTGVATAARPFQPLSLDEVASLFPQLEVLALLGAGGMGAVYKARQRSLDRLVALKILPATGVDAAKFAERFNREARALARLSHPSIVTVHEFGQAAGLHFFIMEFVDGANLRQLEKAGRLSPREALQLIPQICDALQYAHDEGVVHRDIKPENVLVDRRGRVKIADFGLAKILGVDAGSLRLTVEGQVMGTPHYMAPEQVERPLAVDHRADIYSLGVVFYEMLTGDLPLGKFLPPSRKVHVDVRLDDVVLRALENDPERRYQNASEVKSQLETIAGSPAPAPESASAPADPRATPERTLNWGRFPVAIEREGRRRISWRGVLALYFVNFGVLSLLFGVVTVATNGSWWGWLGIIGWPSVIARLLLAAAFSALQVRHVLRRPTGEASRFEAWKAGLSPRTRACLRVGKVIGFTALCAVGWVWFQFAWLIPRLNKISGKAAPAQTALHDERSAALVADLPGGGRIELLAVGEPDAAPDGWWAPNGEPLTSAKYEARNPAAGAMSGHMSKDLLFRVTNLPADVSQVGFETSPSAGGGSGGLVYRDGVALEGGVQARYAWKPDVRRATIQQGFGIGPWQPIATAEPDSQSSRSIALPNHPNWTVRFHQPAQGSSGEAQVTVLFGPGDRLWTHRVVAIGTNGVGHVPSQGQGTPVEKLTLWTYSWRGLAISAIQEFRLEVRPVHWVAFKDVALQPDRPVPPPQSFRFGPEFSKTFGEVIDFDTGRTVDFPTNGKSSNIFEAMAENVQWALDNGYDAAAGKDELRPLDMQFAPVSGAEWETLSATEVVKRIQSGGARARVLTRQESGPMPITYAFRTRQDGIGLLQVIAFGDQQPNVALRYKMVTKSERR